MDPWSWGTLPTLGGVGFHVNTTNIRITGMRLAPPTRDVDAYHADKRNIKHELDPIKPEGPTRRTFATTTYQAERTRERVPSPERKAARDLRMAERDLREKEQARLQRRPKSPERIPEHLQPGYVKPPATPSVSSAASSASSVPGQEEQEPPVVVPTPKPVLAKAPPKFLDTKVTKDDNKEPTTQLSGSKVREPSIQGGTLRFSEAPKEGLPEDEHPETKKLPTTQKSVKPETPTEEKKELPTQPKPPASPKKQAETQEKPTEPSEPSKMESQAPTEPSSPSETAAKPKPQPPPHPSKGTVTLDPMAGKKGMKGKDHWMTVVLGRPEKKKKGE